MAFFLHDVSELDEPEKVITLTSEDFARVNPNTGTAPIFRTKRDAKITLSIYEKFPVLNDHNQSKVWPIKYMQGLFNMTSDSHMFKTTKELEDEGYYPVEGHKLKKGGDNYLPLYVGRMIHHYNHRAASVEVNLENIHNPALSSDITIQELQNPEFHSEPQFWIPESEIKLPKLLKFMLAFRDIARSTDARTFINTLIPSYGSGNKLPLLIPDNDDLETYSYFIPLLNANLASFAFDFITRQKVQSTALNWYIVEQLPVIPTEMFEQKLGKTTVAEFIKEHVLHLTYTAWDMQPFARTWDTMVSHLSGMKKTEDIEWQS